MAFEVPQPEQRLDVVALASVPRESGIYAAWLVDDESLVELGVSGEVPFLLYIGKATGRYGLRQRLPLHVKWPWYEVADLLAAQSSVLPLWWTCADKVVPRRVPPVTPLAQLASDQALRWQHRRVSWGWQRADADDASALEGDLIERHSTLLNRRGRGYAKHGPPQLRAVGEDAAARAWWLFHVAWIAVLDGAPQGWARNGMRGLHIAVDSSGWPVPLGEGSARVVRVPSESTARKLLAHCSPRELRGIVRVETEADEARAWWSAYKGNEFLPAPQSVEDSLAGALSRDAAGRCAPPSLPGNEQLSQLTRLLRTLPGLSH